MANLGRAAEAADDARRSLAVAREIGYPAGEALALANLSLAARLAGHLDGAVRLGWQAERVSGDMPGPIRRVCSWILTEALIDAGEFAGADRVCRAALARARDAGDTWNLATLLKYMAVLNLQAARVQDAAADLNETFQIALRTGARYELLDGLQCCGFLCVATGRTAEAVTIWAAAAELSRHRGYILAAATARRGGEPLREARQALGAAQSLEAQERGTAMSLDTAAEYALVLTAPESRQSQPPGLGGLSARQRELVILVAQGRTDAQIAAQLYISIRTVRSHLDRIRDKTGCRRRADLTRLALSVGLI